jgi:hypothetical protein
MYDTYVKSSRVRRIRRRVQHKFLDNIVPNIKIIYTVLNKLRQMGLLLGKKGAESKCQILTEEKVDQMNSTLDIILKYHSAALHK